MRVLFTISNAHIPQASGGIQSSTHQLASRLVSNGFEIAVSCRLRGGDKVGWRSRSTAVISGIQRRVTGYRYSVDSGFTGYSVYRSWDTSNVTEVIRRFRPDVVVVQQGPDMVSLSARFIAHGIPTVVYLRDAELSSLDGDPSELAYATFIANSHFNASKYLDAYGISSTVIPPLIEASAYATSTSRKTVTFINPVAQKGRNLALSIAHLCPEIPFNFVEGWPLSNEQRNELVLDIAEVPNVILSPRTEDMKSVYANTRILLAPSQWEEAWGRVASEAHCSGIPVLGSNRGGLPEAIGPGGIILPHDAPPGEWAGALRTMWEDSTQYHLLSQAARDFAQREEMSADYQLAIFMDVLRQAVTANKRYIC